MDPIQIPDKTYFKIGEVAKLLDLQPYVLRYWETEFDALRPEKTKSGQRAYRRDDIELLILVKTLLYDEMYTIAGARRQLKLRKKGAIEPLGPEAQQRLVSEHQTLLAEQSSWNQERIRLTEAAEKHREEASRLRVQNETLEDENVQLASAQLEYESSIRRLREESNQQRDVVRQLEDSQQSLQQRMEEMAEDSGARSEEAGLAVANAENVERIAALETAREEAAERADEALRELQANQTRVEELSEALAAATAAVEAAGVERLNLTNELESLEADLASAETELERLEAEKEVLATQALNSVELEALETKLSDALARIEVLQSERDGIVERHEQRSQHQRDRYTFLRHELESLAAIVN